MSDSLLRSKTPAAARSPVGLLRRIGLGMRRGVRRWTPGRRRRARDSTTLCREGFFYLMVLAFVFAAAIIADMNLLMMLAGMLAGPLWFSRRLVRATLAGVEVRRRLPPGVCAGDTLVVGVEIENTRRRLGSWAVVVEEEIGRDAAESGAIAAFRLFFSYVPAGQTRSRVYRGRLVQRGRYRFGPMRISTRFPFGFFRHARTVDQSDVLTVYPRLGRLTQQWLRRHHVSFEGADRRERRHGGVSGDFYGVRPWRDGDSRRMIHWRSSARHGALVVRQFEQQRNRDLAVVVELWQPAVPRPEHLEHVELAVSFAATVVAEACRRGGSDLIVGTTARPDECLRGPASAALLRDVMEGLALAEADREDRLARLLDTVLATVDRGTEVVLISTRPTDLADARRFAHLWRDPGRRALMPQIRTINTASEALQEYFEAQ